MRPFVYGLLLSLAALLTPLWTGSQALKDPAVSLQPLVHNWSVVDGYLVWTSSPDVSDTALIQEYWRVMRGVKHSFPHNPHMRTVVIWVPSQAGSEALRLEVLDTEKHILACTTALPLATSAQTFLDALGCQWGKS